MAGIPDEVPLQLPAEGRGRGRGKGKVKRPSAKAKACAAKKQKKACCVLNSDFSVRSLHIMIFGVAGRSWS